MLACVILNYNDSESVISLVRNIELYSILEKIIVVDNKSTDDSFSCLKKIESPKIDVIQSQKNGGYGYGNNVGIRYAKELGADYVLVCNPDVEFTEKSIADCLKIMGASKECVACAPKEEKKFSAFRFESPLRDVCGASILLNSLLKIRKYDSIIQCNDDYVAVDALSGSLVLFDVQKFSQCGFYDENVFLYHEEIIIGKKFREKGFVQYLYLRGSFKHHHSVSVNKSIKSACRLKKIIMQSQYYYLKNYCHASNVVLLLHKVIRPYCYLELVVWKKIKKFRDCIL